MTDVGPWTRFQDAPASTATAPASSGEGEGPWTRFQKATPGKDAGLYASFLSGFTSDEREQVRMLADRLFPDAPIDDAMKRFSKQDGRIVYRGDDNKLYEALPSGGWRGGAGDILGSVGKMLPAGGGAAAGMATLPFAATGAGLVGTVAAAAGGAAAGEYARQKLGDVLMGRASTGDVSVTNIAREGIESGLGQGIGVGLGAAATRGAVRDIAKFDPVKTKQAYDEAGRVGVPLTPAEATGLPTLAAQQKRLTNITATADEMREFLNLRQSKVMEAWRGFLDGVSKAADAEDVGRLARETSENVLGKMRQGLQAQAKPYYEAAYAAKIPFTKEMEELTKRPTMQEALRRAQRMMEDEGIESVVKVIRNDPKTGKFVVTDAPDVRTWDYIKRGLDDFINSPAARNEATGGLNNHGRIAVKQKQELLDFLDNPKSKAYVPEYRKAREIYQDGAEDITSAMQSALNIIAKTRDTSILSAARHAFDPTTRSPQMVTRLRDAIEKENPDAWQALKRLYIDDVATGALRVTETGEVANAAGKIFKAFANPKVDANLKVAMDGNEYARFKELLGVFRRAASVPALRSDTEFNRLMTLEAEKAAQPFLSKAVGAVKALNPAAENFLGLQSLQRFLTDRNLEKNAAEVVKLVTSGDPDAINRMRELRRLSPGSRQGLVALGHLVSRATGAGISQAVAEADAGPER